jgi:hypothetical protein
MNKNIFKIQIIFYTFIYLIVFVPVVIYGYTMSSTNYRVELDSINAGGTSFSTSSSYSLGSTLGEIGTGYSTSSSYTLSAGYWIPDDIYVSITSVNDVSLGSISGLLGGQSTSTSSWVVTTNNPSGYQMTVVASTDPALKAVLSSIPDYTPVGSDPDFDFSTNSTDSVFGFSPYGNDVIDRFRNNGSVCGFGVNTTLGKCWDGFSTSTKVVSQSMTGNEPSGATTTIMYNVFIGPDVIQDSDSNYSASITVTAIAL